MQPQPALPDRPATLAATSRHSGESAQRARSPASIPATQLFQGSQEILIEHARETYRLRITRNGKLILTK